MNSYYNAANEKIEKWTNRIFEFEMKIFIPCCAFPLMIASYYNYYVMDLAEESFFFILPSAYVETTMSLLLLIIIDYIYFRIPYIDKKTPIGYLLISLINIAMLYYGIAIILCFLFLHFGICVLLVTFPLDLKRNFNDIEEKIRSDNDEKGKLSKTAIIEIEKAICELVEFHSDTLELSKTNIADLLHIELILFSFFPIRLTHQCSNVFNKIIHILFLLSTITLCVFLLQIHSVSITYYFSPKKT